MLKTLEFQVDGKASKDFPESFSEIVFKKSSVEMVDKSVKTVVFEDYIGKPFDGFDFHKKFNKDVPPPEKVMEGIILKETEKMYYFKLKSVSGKVWQGWCPKKSCKLS